MRKLATGQKREKRDIGIALADTDAFAQHRGTWAVTPFVNNDLQGSQRAIQSSGKCTPRRRLSSESCGGVVSSTAYINRITGGLQNPRSTAWNVELERQVTNSFTVRVGYESRNTAQDFVVSPLAQNNSGIIALSNGGSNSYREFQVTAAITPAGSC